MRHQKTRHKLSRSASHRKALLANLCVEVIDHERIKTSEAKAKAVKPEIEKLITLAKKGDLHARRQAMSTLQHPDKGVIYKLFEEIAPRYTERPGGYTRILKLGPRSSDATEMVYLELVSAPSSPWSTTAARSPAGQHSPAGALWPPSCLRRCRRCCARRSTSRWPAAPTAAGTRSARSSPTGVSCRICAASTRCFPPRSRSCAPSRLRRGSPPA